MIIVYNSRITILSAFDQMLLRLCKEHPYHSLYVILALSNASLDNEFPESGYVTGTRGNPPPGKRMKRSSTNPSNTNIKSVDEVRVHTCKYMQEVCFQIAHTHNFYYTNSIGR